jgi:AcrR family transcriptional regulator
MRSRSRQVQRRSPRQTRSRATWEAILEAAAQILERHGAAALTTNRIAERAGVSIGSLYQYFPNKHAVLAELIRRELGSALLSGRLKALIAALVSLLDGSSGDVVKVPHVASRPSGARGIARRIKQVCERIVLLMAPIRPITLAVAVRSR